MSWIIFNFQMYYPHGGLDDVVHVAADRTQATLFAQSNRCEHALDTDTGFRWGWERGTCCFVRGAQVYVPKASIALKPLGAEQFARAGTYAAAPKATEFRFPPYEPSKFRCVRCGTPGDHERQPCPCGGWVMPWTEPFNVIGPRLPERHELVAALRKTRKLLRRERKDRARMKRALSFLSGSTKPVIEGVPGVRSYFPLHPTCKHCGNQFNVTVGHRCWVCRVGEVINKTEHRCNRCKSPGKPGRCECGGWVVRVL